MHYSALFLLAGAAFSVASPVWPRYTVDNEHFEVLALRATTQVNPAAVSDVTCIDPKLNIVFHDQNVAELGICGGIAGSITKCGGAPKTTIGQSGSAKFTLTTATSGATINISKGRWEQCVRAARAICPTGSMSGTCSGGASSGDVNFILEWP
ncbi:hypothetical protein GQX73_g1235 [Xylaria multiplex]|uniref:AA1-like domain-containing protein n=1 Tax=Xylaria multiplex TaxID=323545 RepID=A0A7C8IWN7_9PEZI|nr:hypothetical protein GQX73_g1235 [Xylaria multiplex]